MFKATKVTFKSLIYVLVLTLVCLLSLTSWGLETLIVEKPRYDDTDEICVRLREKEQQNVDLLFNIYFQNPNLPPDYKAKVSSVSEKYFQLNNNKLVDVSLTYKRMHLLALLTGHFIHPYMVDYMDRPHILNSKVESSFVRKVYETIIVLPGNFYNLISSKFIFQTKSNFLPTRSGKGNGYAADDSPSHLGYGYTSFFKNEDSILQSFVIIHELSHHIDFIYRRQKGEFLSDLLEFKMSQRSGFPSKYSETSAKEDFAESLAFFITANDFIKSRHRKRYEFFLKNVFSNESFTLPDYRNFNLCKGNWE